MALSAGNIQFYKSGAGTPNNLGGIIRTEHPLNGSLNDIFDNVSSAEALAGATEYRCIYVRNTSNIDTLFAAKVFQSNTANAGVTYQIGWGLAPINGTEPFVANETTSPAVAPGVTFAECSGQSNAAELSADLGPLQYKAIWIKRIIAASTGVATLATITVTVLGDTVA